MTMPGLRFRKHLKNYRLLNSLLFVIQRFIIFGTYINHLIGTNNMTVDNFDHDAAEKLTGGTDFPFLFPNPPSFSKTVSNK